MKSNRIDWLILALALALIILLGFAAWAEPLKIPLTGGKMTVEANKIKFSTGATTNFLYWPFDNDDDPTADASGNGNEGNLFNAPTWRTNQGTVSAYFDFVGASNQAITNKIQGYSGGAGPFTLSFWFKSFSGSTEDLFSFTDASSPNTESIRARMVGGQLLLTQQSGGNTAALISGFNVADGIWRHVVYESDTGSQRLYIDNVLRVFTNEAVTVPTITDVSAGAFFGPAIANPYDGSLDELKG